MTRPTMMIDLDTRRAVKIEGSRVHCGRVTPQGYAFQSKCPPALVDDPPRAIDDWLAHGVPPKAFTLFSRTGDTA